MSNQRTISEVLKKEIDEAINVTPSEELFVDGKLRIPDEIPIKPYTFHDLLDGKSLSPVDLIRSVRLRHYYISQGMFAFVSWKWVKPLATFIDKKKVLEVMAGRGILAYALRELGINMIATDDFSFARSVQSGVHYPEFSFASWKDPVTDIEEMDALDAIENYGSIVDYLLVSWPYPNIALHIIRKMYEVNPKALVIFIGEMSPANVCGDFANHFSLIDDPLFKEAAANYESWETVHDKLLLGQYRP
jgi:hypothetical protein